MKTPVDFLIFTGRANDIESLSLHPGDKTYGNVFQPLISTTTRTLGAYKVAYHCRLQGFSVQVVDYSKFLSTEQFYSIIDKFVGPNTLAVGTSTTWLYQPLSARKTLNMVGQYGFEAAQWLPVEDFETETNLTNHIKSISPDCKVIVGGAIVNQDSLNNPNIDIVASGYGEVTVPDILMSIKNKTEIRQYYADPHSQHEIATSTMTWCPEDLAINTEALPLEIARGCIFHCSFCSFRLLGKEKGSYVRGKDLIRDELIRNYENFGTTRYWISDDTFNDDNDRLQEFADVVKSLPFKITLSAFIRLDLVMLKKQEQLLKDCGLVFAHCGIETLNEESAKDIGKGFNPMMLMDWLRDIKQNVWKDVFVHSNFILGLPSDSKETLRENLRFLKSDDNPLDSFVVSPLYLPKQGTKSSNEESKFTNDPESFGMEIIPWSDDYLKYVAEGNTFQNYRNKHGVVNEEMFRTRQRFASTMAQHKNGYKFIFHGQFRAWGLDGCDLHPDEILELVKEKKFTWLDRNKIEKKNFDSYTDRLMAISKHTSFVKSQLVDAENLKRVSIARELI